ncbi:MAG: hypothetical protein ACLQOO_33520 [Terriglobia bacterium]
MKISAYGVGILVCLSCLCGGMVWAQDHADQAPRPAVVPSTVEAPAPASSQVVPLTIGAGVPLHVVLEKRLAIKHAGVPVEGHTVEPIYVFDHLVIPAGTRIVGRVSKVEGLSRKQRALTIANGDFTPYRKAYFDFDTLVLKDGSRLPIQTAVSQGAPNMVHLSADDHAKNKGRVSQAVQQARAEAKAREQETVQQITAPGKLERLKSVLVAKLPYHQQALPAGTSFTAELKSPLELGQEERSPNQLQKVGSEIPRGSIVHVRLVTPLSSATDHKGSVVKAVVSEPVFSADRQLVLPEGARLEGVVTQALPARRLGRNGQLRFIFRQIVVGPGAPRNVEASLQGVDAASSAHLTLDSEGGAHAVTPKTHYALPAIEVFLAATSLDLDAGRNHLHPGYQHGPDVGGGAVRGAAGFAFVGSVIGLLAHSRPVSAGLAFYGAGWSVYTHIVERGNEVTFSKNTPMEIRFGTHESAAPPAAKGNPFVAGTSI